MSRLLMRTMLTALLCAGLVGAKDEKEKPRERPAAVGEKTEAKADQSRVGVIDKIEAKDEQTGTVKLRADKDLPRYTFQINKETKLLTDKGDPLEGGLKSPLLKGAEVRIVFIDKETKGATADKEALRLCQTLQIIKPSK